MREKCLSARHQRGRAQVNDRQPFSSSDAKQQKHASVLGNQRNMKMINITTFTLKYNPITSLHVSDIIKEIVPTYFLELLCCWTTRLSLVSWENRAAH